MASKKENVLGLQKRINNKEQIEDFRNVKEEENKNHLKYARSTPKRYEL